MKLILQTDGGSRGNPGPAATGIILKNEQGELVAAYGEYLGIQTNNIAEYSALLSGLKKAQEIGASEVECILDSELVVKQMRREYKVRHPELQKLFMQIYNLSTQFEKITFKHILRAGNKEADAEVNKVLDKETKNKKHSD